MLPAVVFGHIHWWWGRKQVTHQSDLRARRDSGPVRYVGEFCAQVRQTHGAATFALVEKSNPPTQPTRIRAAGLCFRTSARHSAISAETDLGCSCGPDLFPWRA